MCPVCWEKAPLGGGRTVKNAASMFELVQEFKARLKPDAPQASRDFIALGEGLANSLHDYGHQYSMITPDWAAAGAWANQAQALYARLLLREQEEV